MTRDFLYRSRNCNFMGEGERYCKITLYVYNSILSMVLKVLFQISTPSTDISRRRQFPAAHKSSSSSSVAREAL